MSANLESGIPPVQSDVPTEASSLTAAAASGPSLEDQSGPQGLWIILPSSLLLALAIGELCLGFIQKKVPSCKTPFAVVYATWAAFGFASLIRLCLWKRLTFCRLPIAAWINAASIWALLFIFEFDWSTIGILFPLLATTVTLIALFTPSQRLSALIRFTVRLRTGEFLDQDLDQIL